jgi:hypothetical protein
MIQEDMKIMEPLVVSLIEKGHGDDLHFVHWRTLESDASLFS